MNATPAGFVAALEEIKASELQMALYYDPRTRTCRALPQSRKKPPGLRLVGIYYPGMFDVARKAREAVERILCSTGNETRSIEINDLHGTAGRRSP